MTSLDLAASGRFSGLRLALPVFAAALFLSAFLLFSIQPMFAKMVLPILGGAPAVWSVAMVFFQAVLLAGYAYAHGLARLRSTRLAAGLHLAVMASAFLALPIALAPMAQTPPEQGEALWLIAVFALSVGLPFFAVSANGPLLQAWFARSGHPQAADPYFLYGASNIGSFAALIAYPLCIEPFVALGAQARVWTIGFVLLAAAIALAAALASGPRAETRAEAIEEGPAPTARQRLGWVALAAVPSGLLVAVTAHISTDVAAAPLLWVAPLALFLATFVLVFRERPLVSEAALSRAQIALVGLVAAQHLADVRSLWLTLALHLSLFFVAAMACHAALYARRPQAARLTDFYMMMSLGGVVGGVFCGLIAPRIFSSVLEYPMLIAASLACSSPALAAFARGVKDAPILPQGAGAIRAASALVAAIIGLMLLAPQPGVVVGVAVGAAFLLNLRAPRRAAALAVAGVALSTLFALLGAGPETHRSFFGVHKLVDIDGRYRILMHGATVHGAMRLDALDSEPEPLTYYTTAGPLAEALRAVRGAQGGRIARASLVGLGAGSLACQMRGDEDFAFYEIDPVVARLAADPSRFRFLDACAKGKPVVLGDARLTLARAPAGAKALVVDAFSSDAIPAHLLTKEAFAAYFRHLDEDGVVILHVTNRYFDLSRIIARTAGDLGLTTWLRADKAPPDLIARTMRASSTVAVVGRRARDVGVVASDDGRWTRLDAQQDVAPWTDDYSNILQAMADKIRR